MERIQAINLIKEIAVNLPELSPDLVSITEPKTNDKSSQGYTIHFKGLSKDSIEQIIRILSNKPLGFSEKDNELFVYSARKE